MVICTLPEPEFPHRHANVPVTGFADASALVLPSLRVSDPPATLLVMIPAPVVVVPDEQQPDRLRSPRKIDGHR